MSEIDALLEHNAAFAAAFADPGRPAAPARRTAIVACMDARLDVYTALGLAPGDCHVIRNAGGIVSEDVIRSLTISQRMLATTEVALLHHTDCGLLSFTDEEFRASVAADTGMRPPWSSEAFPDLDADVRQSVARVRASPFLPHRDAVRGFVYDVATGRCREISCPTEPIA